MFTTDRLSLRELRSTDKTNLLVLFNDATLMSTVDEDFLVPHGDSFINRLYDYFQKSLMFCIVEERSNSAGTPPRFVGLVNLHHPPDPRNRRGRLGIALLPQFWGMGYGREMAQFIVNHGFEMLGLHRIALIVFEGNDRAIRLYEGFGFLEEGRRRKALWSKGRWIDIIEMGILEDEHRDRKKEGFVGKR